MEKRQAPVIPWSLAKKIANALWRDTSVSKGSNIRMIRHRKAAATVLLLAHKSGGRWIDHHRICWEDLIFSNSNGNKTVQAPLRLSKNNLCNDLPQSLTWVADATGNPTDCP